MDRLHKVQHPNPRPNSNGIQPLPKFFAAQIGDRAHNPMGRSRRARVIVFLDIRLSSSRKSSAFVDSMRVISFQVPKPLRTTDELINSLTLVSKMDPNPKLNGRLRDRFLNGLFLCPSNRRADGRIHSRHPDAHNSGTPTNIILASQSSFSADVARR